MTLDTSGSELDSSNDDFGKIMAKYKDTKLEDLLDPNEQNELADYYKSAEERSGIDVPALKIVRDVVLGPVKREVEDRLMGLAVARLKERVRTDFPKVAQAEVDSAIRNILRKMLGTDDWQ